MLQQQIDKYKYVQKALHKSEAHYSLLVENTNEAIVVIQDDNRKYTNPRAEEIFDCSAEKLTSIPFMEFIHPDDMEECLNERLKRVKQDNLFFTKDTNGNIKHIMENSVMIDWEGHPAILALMTHMTRIKMIEEISKADKIEVISNSAGIAHDFIKSLAILLSNNNLASMYGNKNDMPKVMEKLKELEEATLRARDLSSQLLLFPRGRTI